MDSTRRHPRGCAAIALALVLIQAPPRAADDCPMIFSGSGWAIDTCPEDPAFTERMRVGLDAGAKGSAAMIRI